MTGYAGNPLVTLPNGRTVTAGTKWAVDHWSGRRDVRAGALLVCVHNVALSNACPECKAAA